MGRHGSESSHSNTKYSGVLKCTSCSNAISVNQGKLMPPCHYGSTN